MKKTVRLLITLIVICALVIPRLVDLNVFTAADEPFWLVVGANYYYAITHREFENTIYEYHPAVTTMWIVTAAMLIYFPEYRGLMNGYFQQEKTSFDTYLAEQGKDPLDLLWWSRLLQTLLNVGLWLVAFLLLRHLLDEWTALAVLLLASFAPYLFGQSRMLNHESMLGLFSLNSILAMTVYLFRGGKVTYLVISALGAALANLTKSSSIVLLPVIAAMILSHAFRDWQSKKNIRPVATGSVKLILSWLAMVLLFYFIIWPGMWVAPGKMLYEVYGNAFSYAFLGSRLSVSTGLEPAGMNLITALQSMEEILISIAWRTSPVTWIGILLAFFSFFIRNQVVSPAIQKWLLGFLLLEVLASIIMFGFISGRDSPHYVLVAYVCLEVAAALGWVSAIRWLGIHFDFLQNASTQISVIGLLLGLQVLGLIPFRPYYYTYFNPVLRWANAGSTPRFFYGEGMEKAAAYLAAKPDSQYLTALVYFGRTFSYYFPGDTLVFKPVLFEDKAQLINELHRSDFLVMYYGMQERLPVLKEMTPEHIIYLNDRPYVEIYRVLAVPTDFYEN